MLFCLNFRYPLLSASQVLKFCCITALVHVRQHTIHKLCWSDFCLLYVLKFCCNQGFGVWEGNTLYTRTFWSLPALCAQFLLQSRLWCMRRQRTIHKDLLITISNQLYIGEILKMKNSSLQKIIHCATVCFYSYLGLQLKDVNVFVFSQNLAAYLTSYKLSLASWELSKNLSKTRLRNLATLLISVQKLSRHYHPKDAPKI